uniref:DnaJ homologue subfamily C member 28 conserved domain-containing protein n=1 Tax=Bionectria ochroleuca TaxID=29856 RepID=A0A8H7TSG9_BIOOC
MASIAPRQSVCRRCLRLARPPKSCQTRNYTSPGPRERTVVESQDEKKDISQPSESPPKDPKSSSSSPSQPGAMTRRLQEATEDALLTGGRTSQKLVEDAGFSEELKEKLFNKVKEAQFRKRFSSAFAEAGISSSSSAVGEGSHHIATAAPWTGKETTHDAVLRMLDDSKKPLSPELRGKFRTPVPVDMRIKRGPAMSAASQRVASARDKASVYAGAEAKASAASGKGLTPEEREELRREFRERFQPGARAMPNSITGLAALANERIEDAIARGQFKNIPRGKGVERDARADNPFIDTTEYIMNKMIQRQDIVPPGSRSSRTSPRRRTPSAQGCATTGSATRPG